MDRDALELRRGQERIRLQIQPFRVLEALILEPGRVLTRSELRSLVWPSNVHLDFDHGLNNAVARLREALGDSADNPRFIETLPRVGYRFILPPDQISVPGGPGEAPSTPAAPAWWRRVPLPIAWSLAALVITVLVAGVARLTARDPANGDDSARPALVQSVAVLPTRDLTADADQDYFAAGMTDALIARLAQSTSLRVISRRSAERFRNSSVPLVDIARELNVDGVIDTVIFRQGDRLRVDVQLVRAADGSHVWANNYERPLENVFQLQQQLADDIAGEITDGTDITGPLASVARSDSLEAYQLYLQGRHLWNQRSPDSVMRSIDFFERAIALDPGFAAAHAGLAESYALIGGTSLVKSRSLADVLVPAMRAAERAIELDPLLAEAHAAMARVLGLQARNENHHLIEEHYIRALALNPTLSETRLGYGNYLSRRGRSDVAIREFREALLHDPVSPNIVSRLGKELVDTGQTEEGLELLERAIEIEPWQFNSHIRLGWTYAAFDRLDEAEKSFAKAEQINPGTIHAAAGQAFVAARRGDRAAVERQLELIMPKSEEIDLPFLVALIYVALQDREPALEWLEKAAPLSSPNFFKGLYRLDSPMYDWLRDDPRFEAVVRVVRNAIDEGF